ncbi:MAG TPA: hypothetical protein VHM28_08655, partial [Anaerolineales bacterium]|nr:hypothetical protein [Anaerolineales bacterium]
MKRIESTLQVFKPVESVFAFMSAAENHARFIPNMDEFKQTSDSPFGKVGATAQGRLNYFDILHIQVP